MKIISLVAICVGVICLAAGMVGHFTKNNLITLIPINSVVLATCFFLLAIALMCYSRFYCSDQEKK